MSGRALLLFVALIGLMVGSSMIAGIRWPRECDAASTLTAMEVLVW